MVPVKEVPYDICKTAKKIRWNACIKGAEFGERRTTPSVETGGRNTRQTNNTRAGRAGWADLLAQFGQVDLPEQAPSGIKPAPGKPVFPVKAQTSVTPERPVKPGGPVPQNPIKPLYPFEGEPTKFQGELPFAAPDDLVKPPKPRHRTGQARK